MCEQCVAETTLYVGPGDADVLPGFGLVRATKDGWLMKKGDWGLVHVNDPDYWWSPTPVEDPLDGLSDEEIDKLPPEAFKTDDYDTATEKIDDALSGRSPSMLEKDCHAYPRFEDAARLYDAAKQAGYDRARDGRFAAWLCHRLAIFLKTAKAYEHLDQRPSKDAPEP